MIEYYTGRDASLMTDGQIAMKLAHLERIRAMERDHALLIQSQLFKSG